MIIFLSKVLHGDLAARNVLLADDGVVKVADFGLSRRLYHDEQYLKHQGAKLPIKWMAIESLADRIFSSQSDVWSFGVVLWELFSLGRSPYPGISHNQLLRQLLSGYWMEKPECSSHEINQIMNDCWKAEPKERPTFHQLEEALGRQLENSVQNYYLVLNEPYALMNNQSIDKPFELAQQNKTRY